MQQHRRLHSGFHLAGGPYPFGSGLDSALAPEPASNDRRAPYVVVLNGRDEIVLKVRPGPFARDPLLRLDATAARRLAGELLVFAGAIDGAPSD
ncbi:MAG TPA: hypothetical protein VF744_13120 [Beijerinckiaceae bacterium]|jgi:hypothetical protein